MERDVSLPFAHLPRIRTNFTCFLPISRNSRFTGRNNHFYQFFPPPSSFLSPCFLDANLNFVKKEAPFAIGISFRHANESAHCVEADSVVLHVVWDFLRTVCDFMEFLHGKGIALWLMERFGEAIFENGMLNFCLCRRGIVINVYEWKWEVIIFRFRREMGNFSLVQFQFCSRMFLESDLPFVSIFLLKPWL